MAQDRWARQNGHEEPSIPRRSAHDFFAYTSLADHQPMPFDVPRSSHVHKRGVLDAHQTGAEHLPIEATSEQKLPSIIASLQQSPQRENIKATTFPHSPDPPRCKSLHPSIEQQYPSHRPHHNHPPFVAEVAYSPRAAGPQIGTNGRRPFPVLSDLRRSCLSCGVTTYPSPGSRPFTPEAASAPFPEIADGASVPSGGWKSGRERGWGTGNSFLLFICSARLYFFPKVHCACFIRPVVETGMRDYYAR